MLIRILFILFLIICYKYTPVFEPIGFNYIISLFTLAAIVFEIHKLWQKLNLNEIKKKKIQKTAYLALLCTIFILLTLVIHKANPAGNIRFIRSVIILITIVLGSKIVKEISTSSVTNFLKNCTLVLFSTASFLGLIEICFMFISLSHGSGEAYSGKIWGEKYWNPINKYGFRDENPKNGKNTVFFIGDSYTAGWGVKHIENRFSEITSYEFKKKGKIINEINLGRYGADTKLEYYIFENFIRKSTIKPDQIVLQFFVNDMDKFIPKNKNCNNSPIAESRWKKLINESSYLTNFLFSLYPTSNRNNKLPKECDYLEQLKNMYQKDSIWKKEEQQLNKFKNYCSKNKIPLTVIFFPFMEDLTLAKKLNIENRITTYCKENKIKLLNVTPLLLNSTRKERQVNETDAHASEEVHKIVGKKLATIIKS